MDGTLLPAEPPRAGPPARPSPGALPALVAAASG